MKNCIKILALILFFSGNSFATAKRIVFFAETSDIPQNVINEILVSKRFCLTVPVDMVTKIPENLEALVSYGKAELSFSFSNEAVLPTLAAFSTPNLKKISQQNIFQKYVDQGMEIFTAYTSKDFFALFIKSGILSDDVLKYFEGGILQWVNASNVIDANGVKIKGAFSDGNCLVFAPFEDFPTSREQVMKWLVEKEEKVIPVLLKKKHLQNYAFMEYLIDFFDNSIYIKPAIPSFIKIIESDSLLKTNSIQFEKFTLDQSVEMKLNSAAKMLY